MASNQELQEAARFHDVSLFSRQVVAVVETDVVWSETARPPHPSRDWAPDASGIGIEGGRGLSMVSSEFWCRWEGPSGQLYHNHASVEYL